MVFGKDNFQTTVVTVSFDSVQQDGNYLSDTDVVDAMKTLVASKAGITQVSAQKTEQITTPV